MIIYSKGGAKLEVSLKEFPGIFPDSQSELSRQKKGRPEPLFSFSFESGPFQRLLLSVSVRAITIPTTAIISTENTIILTPPTLKPIPLVTGGVGLAVKRNKPVPINERIATAPQTAKTINRISAGLCRVINPCFDKGF